MKDTSAVIIFGQYELIFILTLGFGFNRNIFTVVWHLWSLIDCSESDVILS